MRTRFDNKIIISRYTGKWTWFGRQDSSGKSNFSKTLGSIKIITLTGPTVGGMRRGDLVVCFDLGRVYHFFFSKDWCIFFRRVIVVSYTW